MTNKNISIIIIFLVISIFAQSKVTYLFSYFKNNGEDGMHLAYSFDGESFTALNNDMPLIKPQIGKDKLMRDPSITRGPDGTFHLVWTSGWNDRCIGYANSKDLINWSKQDSIFVMKNEPTAKNCWAPEIFYDSATSQFIIIWATTIPGKFPETQVSCDGGNNHRLYYVTSKDMKTFSETKLFYDPGFNCIDGFIAKDENRYVLVLKDETCTDNTKGTVAAKNLRIAFANTVTGPYGNLTGVINTGADWVEGPSLIKIGSTWFLYYDIYTKGRYGIRKSKDLLSWTLGTDNMVKPSGARHGTVFAVTGFVIDKNEPNGFRWENTSVEERTKLNKDKYILSLVNNKIYIESKSIRIYSLTGRQIAYIRDVFSEKGKVELKNKISSLSNSSFIMCSENSKPIFCLININF